MATRRKVHIAGMGGRTACGLKLSRGKGSPIAVDLSRHNYHKVATCKSCKRAVGHCVGDLLGD